MIKSIIYVILFCLGSTVSVANEVKDWGGLEIHIYEVDLTKVPDNVFDFAGEEYLIKNKTAIVVSVLSPSHASKHGLTGKLILGVLNPMSKKVSIENFHQNQAFRELVQQFAAKGEESGLKEYISSQRPEFVAAIDQRTNDVMGDVPNEDIIGVYNAKKGKLVGFSPNNNFQLVTKNGIAKFTPGIVKQIKEYISNYK